MLTTPVRHPLGATISDIRDFFRDDHVHAALIVGPAGYLTAVVERGDIPHGRASGSAAAPLGRLAGRIVFEGASLTTIYRSLNAAGQRRAAVVSEDGRLLGLLCLKANGAGFCSEEDVHARALDAGRDDTRQCSTDQQESQPRILHGRSRCRLWSPWQGLITARMTSPDPAVARS